MRQEESAHWLENCLAGAFKELTPSGTIMFLAAGVCAAGFSTVIVNAEIIT